jgi:hypothetical protein
MSSHTRVTATFGEMRETMQLASHVPGATDEQRTSLRLGNLRGVVG